MSELPTLWAATNIAEPPVLVPVIFTYFNAVVQFELRGSTGIGIELGHAACLHWEQGLFYLPPEEGERSLRNWSLQQMLMCRLADQV